MSAADGSVAKVGEKLGVDAAEAARGIIRIANNNMVNALKLVSLNRGHDPRDFTLVAFGGGGGMHAVALAAELGVKKVIVPAGAAVFSAWGMMMSDLRRDYFVTRLAELKEGSAESIEELFAETEALARSQFAAEGIAGDKVEMRRYGKFRYQNQEHTTEVLIDGAVSDANLAAIEASFHETYEREYTYRLDAPVEMVGIHLIASAQVGKLTPTAQPLTDAPASDALKGRRDVDYALEGVHEADIYDGEALLPGMKFTGPAIIEDSGTTTVIHPGNRVEVDAFGNVHITVSA
jgi:N-methylhydantoinase A